MFTLGFPVTPWLVRKHLIPNWIVCSSLLSRPCHPQYALKVGTSQGLISAPPEAGGGERGSHLPSQLLAGLLGASGDCFWLPSFSNHTWPQSAPARALVLRPRWPASPQGRDLHREAQRALWGVQRGPALAAARRSLTGGTQLVRPGRAVNTLFTFLRRRNVDRGRAKGRIPRDPRELSPGPAPARPPGGRSRAREGAPWRRGRPGALRPPPSTALPRSALLASSLALHALTQPAFWIPKSPCSFSRKLLGTILGLLLLFPSQQPRSTVVFVFFVVVV